MTTSPERPAAGRVLRDPVLLAAFGFGLGLAPRAPGTCGTLLGVALQPAVALLAFAPRLAAIAVLFAFGVWLCGAAARRLGTHDHPGIVFDEVVGYLVAMLGAPAGWAGMAAGFVLFRLFDVWKPWPVGVADRRVPGGLGIMLDDLVAGALAAAILSLARWSGAFGGG